MMRFGLHIPFFTFLSRQNESGDTFGQIVERADLGVDHAIISLRNVHELEPFDLLATEVIPQVERLPVAGRAIL